MIKTIEQIQEEMNKLQADLDALKAAAEEPKLWRPKVGDTYFMPVPRNPEFFDSWDVVRGCSYLDPHVERGLAFRTAEQAATVGEYLAVIAKICNLAMTMNEGKEFDECRYYIHSDMLNGIQVIPCRFTITDPIFAEQKDAERALAELSVHEREVLLRGIS